VTAQVMMTLLRNGMASYSGFMTGEIASSLRRSQ